jgi:enoyl-CoA hydratase/carnithine racemase
MSESPRILVEKKDHIAYVYMNRPEKHNGLDMPMFKEMVKASKEIRKDRNIRAVILSGNGPSFCAGLDFSYVSKNPTFVPKVFLKLPWTRMNLAQRIAHCWRDVPVPVISVIHGNCFGGGIQIALATDYRIAKEDANLSIMEMKWGLIPDMSAMVNISRLTRIDIAQELIMTGRQFSAKEAFEYGLISKLSDDPMKDAEELASTIAEKSPDAIAASKYLLKKTWKADTRIALLWERLVQFKLLGRKNNQIAVKNGLSKGKESKPFLNRTKFN